MKKLCALLLTLSSLLPAPAGAQAGDAQAGRVEAGGQSVPLTLREEYLGKSGAKTVVKFILSVPRGELKRTFAAPRVYSFNIVGEVQDPDGKTTETFRVPVDVDLSGDASGPLSASFLRPLSPGPQSIRFQLEGVAGKAVGTTRLSLVVPAMQSEFVAEPIAGASNVPSAAAVILEDENREKVPPGTTGLVKILPPPHEVPVGLLRVGVEVKPPVTRVEFYLDEKRLLVKNRPPYEVEVDLGKIPRKQTLKALGFDKRGTFVDADAWAINERDARLAVSILELPAKLAADVELKVAVQSIAGGTPRSVKVYADDQLLKEWTSPPYSVTLPSDRLKKATLLRATAVDEEGKEYSDLKLLKGESRFISRVEVDLVELNVSVLDAEGRSVKGLSKGDFTVLEDGAPQELRSFEFTESLPLSLGIVIDGSGSMKDSMPLVHEAATEFIQKLITEKDQGFVMEFRESPVLLAAMSKRPADLIRAVRETRASGGTALYDSVVMALYQFRAVPGKKAVVILSDGKDNHSWTDYATLRRYARSAGVPLYFIGLDISFLEVGLKTKMNELAADTGAEAFYVGSAKDLAQIYRKIEAELRSQYFMSYLTSSKKPDDQFRAVEVRLKDPKLKARTIRGYFP